MRVSTVTTYDGLPISSGGGHTLRTRSPLQAMQQVLSFIAACTDSALPQETNVEVISGDGVPDEFSIALTRRLTAELGNPNNQYLGGAGLARRWTIEPLSLDSYVQSIENLKPLPSHAYRLQPFAVTALYKFHLINTESKVPWPNQGAENYFGFSPGHFQLLGESHLYTRISERSSMSLFLNFPCDNAEALSEAAAQVQANLPFKLSNGHWKRWQLSKNGKSYVGRKTGSPLART